MIVREALVSRTMPPAHLIQRVWCRQTTVAQCIVATRGRKVDCLLRHEVARLIVWHAVRTRPAVPSAVSYEDVREGNDPYRAFGHSTHSHPTGTRTVRGRCICQHQAEMGPDGWYGEHT